MRWIWLVVLCACGDNVVPRLAPVIYDIGGTAFAPPDQFRDTARAEACTPITWSDGATYCTPAFRDAVYTDPACGTPIARDTARYVATYFTLHGQTNVRRLHPVTHAVAAPAQYWQLVGDACTGPYTPDAGQPWSAVGDELDASAFVRLYRSAPEGAGRLQTIAWNTSDGLHVPAALHDRVLATDCRPPVHHDVDATTCEPDDAAPATYYLDAACTQPAAVTTGAAPAFASWGSGCPTFAPVSTETTGQPLYDLVAGICTPATLPTGWRQFAVGAPVELAMLQRERAGDARMKAVTLVGEGVRFPDLWLYDTQLDADCTPGELAGELRCIPPAASVTTYYRDDQCGGAVDVVLVDPTQCSPQVRYALGPDAYHRIGEVIRDAIYVMSTGDRCMAQPPPAPLETHAIGPPLPVETFVPAL